MILKETILSAFNERGTLLKWLKKVEALTSDIIERAILKPTDNPQSTNLVAVDNTGAQVMLEVGTGLTIDNGVLKLANVYDGTVIIEKPESVLGLRRFKEYTTREEFSVSYNECTNISNNATSIDELLCKIVANGIEYNNLSIQAISVDEDAYMVMLGQFIITDGSVSGVGETLQLGVYNASGVIDWSTNTDFELVSLSQNEAYNAWLLANTEGVSI